MHRLIKSNPVSPRLQNPEFESETGNRNIKGKMPLSTLEQGTLRKGNDKFPMKSGDAN